MQDEKKVSQDLQPCLINLLQSTSLSSASQINERSQPAESLSKARAFFVLQRVVVVCHRMGTVRPQE
jgi:hypothetical protein